VNPVLVFSPILCTGGVAKLFLRRIKKEIFKLSDFNIPREGINFLVERILKGDNIILAGAAGSGKTSLMVTLIDQLPKNQHVVVLEDTREIPKLSKNFSFFLGQEGISKKSLKDYYALSLRLRPDRIVLGEMRSHEIIPFILSLNTGHKGILSTIHSDSAADAIPKMAMLFNLYASNPGFTYKNSLKLICKNIDLVIYMKKREVFEVIRIIGASEDGVLYENKMW
jgi:Flp pilus assembly CpaF family ATPase